MVTIFCIVLNVVPNLQVANGQFINKKVKIQVGTFFIIKYLP